MNKFSGLCLILLTCVSTSSGQLTSKCFTINGKLTDQVAAVYSEAPAGDWYGYNSLGPRAHTPLLLEERMENRDRVNMFFVESESDGLHFGLMLDHPDSGTSGKIDLDFLVSPIADLLTLKVSDDPGETSYDNTTGIIKGTYAWNERWMDGMVIGPFPDVTYCITVVRAEKIQGLDGGWAIYDYFYDKDITGSIDTLLGLEICTVECVTPPPTEPPPLPPTTLSPTTYPPTTMPPTEQPTTAPPTTLAPTTTFPTTGPPIVVPTAQSPTTEVPTTNAPTTAGPTARTPTTVTPTTQSPTTKAPTGTPTTVAPTTRRPTTEAPTTRAPSKRPTSTPTTLPPTTQAPVDIVSGLSDGVDDSDGVPLWVVILIIVLLLLCCCCCILIVLFLCWRKRKKDNTEKKEPPPAVNAPVASVATPVEMGSVAWSRPPNIYDTTMTELDD